MQVLKIKPTMSSAQTYLSSNVVERLTRPIAAQQAQHDDSSVQHFDPQSATNERPILDMASFMGSLGGTGAKAGDNSFNTPGKPTGGKAGAATESKAKRDAKFEMFLARQQANLKKRADSQKLVRAHSAGRAVPCWHIRCAYRALLWRAVACRWSAPPHPPSSRNWRAG